MSVLTKKEETEIKQKFEELLTIFAVDDKPEDVALIRKAFNIAFQAHKNMRRKSGEPYIYHPLAVARIVSEEIGLGTKSIISSLLHDVVEDTEYTIEEIRNNFGNKIASIIDGLTKINDVINNDASLQAENFRKMMLTLSDDVRVILIKLADRLHNMRTLDSMPPNKQQKIAAETIYLYAPLAHRLGLYAIKTELEDLSLKFRHPKLYDEIVNRLKDNEKKRIEAIHHFSLPISEALEKNNIKFEITGRPKSIYSIYYKMHHKNVPFEEVYDLLAVRIVFDPIPGTPEKTQCWHIYSLITDIYMPKPDRIRDWVSTPKANGYEALHATVMGPTGQWVEVQIRTRRMDDIAERGYAAHWKYKDSESEENELDKWLRKVSEMLENPHANAVDFLDEFKMNLFASEIMAFTPKGTIITLPVNSTALDFAYEIHTEIGNKAIGAKVNHKLEALNFKLNSGDQVEIITSDKQRSQKEWLDYVVTAKAKAAINNSIKSEIKNRIERGKTLLEGSLKEAGLLPSSRIFKKLIPAYEVTSKDELYSKIGSGIINLDNLKKILKKNTRNKWIKYWELSLGKTENEEKEATSKKEAQSPDKNFDYSSTLVLKENLDDTDPPYRIAKCCNPIPGDDIIGHKSANNAVIIHKSRCPNAMKLMTSQGNLIVSAKWTTYKVLSFLARIKITGFDRFGIYNNITTVISKELKVNIRNINLEGHDGIFEGIIDLYVHSAHDLDVLISNIMKIKGVESVSRIENFES
jgi:GTP diphosphokinase / guanosine-3',5'-bis(diphosphate) 3'-diphosphatase